MLCSRVNEEDFSECRPLAAVMLVLIFLSFSKSFHAQAVLQEHFLYVADEARRRGPVGDHMLGHR